MPATLKKIADELGVSPMTVSRALRAGSRINPKTRRQVRDAAERFGYRPVVTGGVVLSPRRHGKRNHVLRVLLPTVSLRIGAEGGAWYLDRMVNAMRDCLEVSKGRLVEQHFPTIDALLDEWLGGTYHAVVLRQPLPDQWVKRLLKIGPVIYAVEFDHQLDVDSVYSNEHRSAGVALDYLSARGHRDIAWFGILDRNAPYQIRFGALDRASFADRQTFSVHGARHAAWGNIAHYQLDGRQQPVILVERDWSRTTLDAAVAQGVDRLLALGPRPTAVVCSCDPIAISLMSILKGRGLRVPDDLSIVSYGGSDDAKGVDPPLTTVEMPMETIGRVIPELIERRLADANAAPLSMQFQTTLYEGGSVADLRDRTDQR